MEKALQHHQIASNTISICQKVLINIHNGLLKARKQLINGSVIGNALDLLRKQQLNHPALKTIAMLLKNLEVEFGNGTSFCLLLIHQLLNHISIQLKNNHKTDQLIIGYNEITQKIISYLPNLISYKIQNLKIKQQFFKSLYSLISSKCYQNSKLITQLIVDACMNIDLEKFSKERVTIYPISGLQIGNSNWIKGIAIHGKIIGKMHIKQNLSIASYSCAIDTIKTQLKGNIYLSNSSQLSSYSNKLKQSAQQFALKLKQAKINTIIFFDLISQFMAEQLEKHQIMIIQAQNYRQVKRIIKLIGGKLLSILKSPSANEIGNCTNISIEKIHKQEILVIKLNQSSSTIFINGNNATNLTKLIQSSIVSYQKIINHPVFIPGAGCIENIISQRLRKEANNFPKLQKSFLNYAQSLEKVSITLFEKIVDRQKLKNNEEYYGIEIKTGQVKKIQELKVYEHLKTKQQQFKIVIKIIQQIIKLTKQQIQQALNQPIIPGIATDRQTAEKLDQEDPLRQFRKQFMIYDPDQCYLVGNSLGRISRDLVHNLNTFVTQQVCTQLVDGWRNWLDLPYVVGDVLARAALGTGPGQTLVNDTTTINFYQLCGAVAKYKPQRKTVIIDSVNFPTDRYALAGLAQQMGLNLITLNIDGSGGPGAVDFPSQSEIIQPEDLKKFLSQDVAFVTLQAINYRSGVRQKIKQITQLVRSYGGFVIWDCSHGCGAIKLDFDENGVDLAVGCTYKYGNSGPGSPGWLFVRKQLQNKLEVPIKGWYANKNQFEMGPFFVPNQNIGRFTISCPSVVHMTAVKSSFQIIQRATIDQIQKKAAKGTQLMIQLVDAWLIPLGFKLQPPRDWKKRGGHIRISHPQGMKIAYALRTFSNVISDFRKPDTVRIAVNPLTTSYGQIWEGISRIRELVKSGIHLTVKPSTKVT